MIALLAALATPAFSQSVTTEPPPIVAQEMGPPYYSGVVLPTPRQVQYGDDCFELIDGPGGEWRCRIEIAADDATRELLRRLLDNRLDGYLRQFPGVREAGQDAPALSFGPGQDPEGSVPEQGLPQSYSLRISPDGVVCRAAGSAGLVNGMASLLQLVHVRDGKLVARSADMLDWPSFTTRYTSEYFLPGPEFLDWMMLYKINGFAACYPGMRWEGNSDAKREGLKVIGDYIRRYGTLGFLVEFHIGGRAGRPVDCGAEGDLERLLDTISETMRLSHASHVMICYDDVGPQLQPEESKRWQRPAQAHGYLMARVYERVKSLDPKAIVSFCTPYYQGRKHPKWRKDNPSLPDALDYMADVRSWENRDIRIVWTGPVTESRLIEQEDIDAYRELVGEDRELFYWDNTWHYHQPLRNFHAKYPADFVTFCADRTSYVNINGVRPIGRFFSVTANDYYWNPEAFDPAHSRKHAVAQFMGPQTVPAAEAFYRLRGDDYFAFFSRDVDLEALERVVVGIEAKSLDEALSKHCRSVYESIAERRGTPVE